MSTTPITTTDVPESNETMTVGNETDVSNNESGNEAMSSSKDTVALLEQVTALCTKLTTMDSNEETSTATLLADMRRVIDDALGHGGEHDDSDAHSPQSNSTGGQQVDSTGIVATPWRPKHGYRRHYSTPPSMSSPSPTRSPMSRLLLRSVKQADVHLDTITDAESMEDKSEAAEADKENKAPNGQMTFERVYYLPANDHTNSGGFNVVGRLLGPRGSTIQHLESLTGCTVQVRGAGSVKSAVKERALQGRRGWEHLKRPLHVLVAADRADEKEAMRVVDNCVAIIRELVKPVDFDHFKQSQLIELAKTNGIYRVANPPIAYGRQHMFEHPPPPPPAFFANSAPLRSGYGGRQPPAPFNGHGMFVPNGHFHA